MILPRKFESLLKNYIIFGFFLVFPLISTFLPTIVFFLTINAIRYFLLPLVLVSLLLFFERKIFFQKRSIAFLYLIYTIYSASNEYGQLGEVNQTLLVSNLILVLVLLLINAINFNENDVAKIQIGFMFLSVIVCTVGLIQLFIKPNFFLTKNPYVDPQYLHIRAFGTTDRIRSIFTNLEVGEGWIFTSLISIILLFMIYEKFTSVRFLIWITSLISVFITFTRGMWMISLIGIVIFIFFKRKHTSPIFLIVISIIFVIIADYLPTIKDSIEDSDFYRQRLTSKSYLSRVDTYSIFLTKSIDESILFGFGSDYPTELIMKYGHNARSLNGFFSEYIKGGIIGFSLFVFVYIKLLRMAKIIYRKLKNPVGFAIIISLIAVNFNAADKSLFLLPYYLTFVYLEMYYQIAQKRI